MATFNGLPVYKVKIDTSLESKEGIDMISLVSEPAIESNFVALNKNIQKVAFNKAKQILYGAILIPGKFIYRNDPKMGEYYCVFEEADIELMVRKFQTLNKSLNVNYQHQADSQVATAVVQEIWLSGIKDKSQDLGFDFPKGTAMVGTYIADSKFWQGEVETKKVQGYSIEGWLDMVLSKITNKQKYMEAKTKDGSITIKTADESFVVGSAVMTVGADGVEAIAANGDYELENGIVLKVVDGKVTEIVEVAEAPEEAMTEEQIAVIQSAIAPILEKYEIRIKELETKLANTPAAPSVTEKKESPKEVKPIAMTAFDKFTKIVNAAKELKNKQ